MRVCHLTSVHSRFDTRIYHKECRSLARSGHEVSLIVADGKGNAEVDGISILDVGASKGRIRRMMGAARRVGVAAKKLDAEIYHFHDPELMPIGLHLKRCGKVVIFDAHEDVPKQLLSKPYLTPRLRRILSWVYTRYERRCCGAFDAIVAATPYIRDRYMTLHERVVDVNNFPILDELISLKPWLSKEIAVCYIGGICRTRGILEVIAALAVVRSSIQLHVAGTFSDSTAEAHALLGWQRVTHWGQVNRQGVREILDKSIAGLVTLHPTPAYLDSLPVKMFEYMSAGIPVIASHFPLWRQVIEGNCCGICVDPLDPAAIAKAIDMLMTNPALAQEMGANGRKAVEEQYNWDIEEKKLLDLYSQLLENDRLA